MIWVVLALPILPGAIYVIASGDVATGILLVFQWMVLTVCGLLEHSAAS